MWTDGQTLGPLYCQHVVGTTVPRFPGRSPYTYQQWLADHTAINKIHKLTHHATDCWLLNDDLHLQFLHRNPYNARDNMDDHTTIHNRWQSCELWGPYVYSIQCLKSELPTLIFYAIGLANPWAKKFYYKPDNKLIIHKRYFYIVIIKNDTKYFILL